MKTPGILIFFLCFSSLLYCQEIPQLRKLPETNQENFLIKRIPINPSLSNLGPEIPLMRHFELTKVNFDAPSINPHGIDIAQLAMEDEKEKQARLISLNSPVQVSRPAKTFSFSAHPNEEYDFSTHSFVPKFPSNTTPNSVYQDAGVTTGAFYLNSYSPFYRTYSY